MIERYRTPHSPLPSPAPLSETSMLDLDFAQLSDTGRREHNEDFVGYVLPRDPNHAREHGWLFAIADGVGGHDRGEVASRVAVETLLEGFQSANSGEPLTGLLPKLVQRANTRVYETAMSTGPGGSSMASTIVACALRYDRAVISHVGDSRCYLIRQGYATAVTRDHTISAEQLRMGVITAREAAGSQVAHVLSRSVGSGMFVSVETTEHQLFTGDVLLLCSDGLHNCVDADELPDFVAPANDLDESAAALVSLANTRDGGDNISVQLIRIKGVERVGMYRGRQYKLR